MNFIDTRASDAAASEVSDPTMLIVFLQYALEDVRQLSERSAYLLEQAIGALAQEAAAVAHPGSLS